ncbi:putative sterol 24-C-methyltransferase [Helianthus annuus]|uniref:Methyltransferase n=2 Tax=Helianthus annuus TaxID=4232 RepID=A0A9K3E3Y0_HELAN|nr:probable pectin methyltransferase QUA2 [Helianthus annuus]XP_022012896.1 probable pectin methyltransferase QUA2 [Helianthus annuus]XP_022012897.1 probable pectin methyltransferase QUA2 [Helianthus annuus]XP_022012898.1 probable pectin methyltransferase QUA2 [Helianthus annuus]XP_022012899.1 probable pectin methyltransferase QUA2 [Helianthus annuus]XP_035839655.1 probable pectin methyltransferase QUA2 [Helianthus annuus]XP_035839656.1 probable pectin methyltransferase QUA2 [Helianthus annuu
MARPLHRGVLGGGRLSGNIQDYLEDTQMKIKTDKEDFDKTSKTSSDPVSLSLRNPFQLLLSENTPSKQDSVENGFAVSDQFTSSSRNRHLLTLLILKFSLILIVILGLTVSLLWTISLTTGTKSPMIRGYRRLQEQLVSDLWDIGELSLGANKVKESEFCSPEFENFVPCFNTTENLELGLTEGKEFDRRCGPMSKQNCLILAPPKYKVPHRWPTGRDVIWIDNVKITAQEVLSSGSLTKRMMMLDEDQISFSFASSMVDDNIEDYSHQIAEMIGLRNESYLVQAGVRAVLDIGCGYGSLGAHLFPKQILTMCIAHYESSDSQVQITLERGLPAIVGSFASKQLPFPSLSFDMIHTAWDGVQWDKKDGIYLIEVDRVLRPGGYFVWTSAFANIPDSVRDKENLKRWDFVRNIAKDLCWDLLSQQDKTVVWKKPSNKDCYASRKHVICKAGHDVESPYYHPLEACIGGTRSRRWIPIEERATWPSRATLSSKELALHGVLADDFAEDNINWKSAVRDYWSLLSPLIFSDHPKRPGDEDPIPPYNMVRNVLDMNAHFGGFNSALLDARKSVWVMNVVPTSGVNHLPLILDRGFLGVLHDWCEAFPTYPRTYDMVHADGLLSLETVKQSRCSTLDLFYEIDRLLRPEGWVILRDTTSLIQSARAITAGLKWEARVVEIESNNDEKLLVCQKPLIRSQASSL